MMVMMDVIGGKAEVAGLDSSVVRGVEGELVVDLEESDVDAYGTKMDGKTGLMTEKPEMINTTMMHVQDSRIRAVSVGHRA